MKTWWHTKTPPLVPSKKIFLHRFRFASFLSVPKSRKFSFHSEVAEISSLHILHRKSIQLKTITFCLSKRFASRANSRFQSVRRFVGTAKLNRFGFGFDGCGEQRRFFLVTMHMFYGVVLEVKKLKNLFYRFEIFVIFLKEKFDFQTCFFPIKSPIKIFLLIFFFSFKNFFKFL